MDNTVAKVTSAQMTLFRKVYFWLSLALALTGLTAFLASNNPAVMNISMGSRAALWILFIIQLGMVM